MGWPLQILHHLSDGLQTHSPPISFAHTSAFDVLDSIKKFVVGKKLKMFTVLLILTMVSSLTTLIASMSGLQQASGPIIADPGSPYVATFQCVMFLLLHPIFLSRVRRTKQSHRRFLFNICCRAIQAYRMMFES